MPRSDRLVTRTGHLTADPPDGVGYCAVTGEAVAASRAASSAAWAGVSAACWGLGRLVGRIGVRGGGRDGSGRRGGSRPSWPSSGRLTPGVTEHHADHETETEAGGDADGCDGSRPDSSEIEQGCSELSCSKRHVRPRRGPGRKSEQNQGGRVVRSGFGWVDYLRMFTARAITNPTVTSDTADWVSMVILAHRVKGSVSVGLNAVAFVNER